MRSNLPLLLGLALLGLLTAPVGAKTIHVATTGDDTAGDGSEGNPYGTIQKAIDQAFNGDTVQVAAGTYRENIFWDSKSLSLAGAGDGDEDGHPDTIVDGDVDGDGAGEGTCLTLTNVPDTASITGFTFRNGSAQRGAGLNLDSSAPRIADNEITDNSAAADGGGMYLENSAATLTGNTITDNRGSHGGGVFLENSAATLTDNTILGNESTANLGSATGGGVFMRDSAATLTGNTLTDNTAASTNSDSYGGGLYLETSAATLTGNTITGNSAETLGGGMYLYLSPVVLESNTFSENTTEGKGGGIYLFGSDATLTNNLFWGNQSNVLRLDQGSGMYLLGSDATVTNNTIVDNVAEGVVVDVGNPGTPTLTNCILWGNGGNGDLINATATYSDIGTGETDGEGNITADPQFVGGGDYHLQASSPCINRGSNAAPDLPETDIDGDPRIFDGIVDMGADEVSSPPSYQPDLWIKHQGAWLGDDVYNGSGKNQTARQKRVTGEIAKFKVRLYNDGTEAETYFIHGPAGDAEWTVEYYKGSKNVTGWVTSTKGWRRRNVPPGGVRPFRIEVTPSSGLASGSVLKLKVRAEAQRDPTQRDVVKAVTRVK